MINLLSRKAAVSVCASHAKNYIRRYAIKSLVIPR